MTTADFGRWRRPTTLRRATVAGAIAFSAILAPLTLARQGDEAEKKPELQTLFMVERGVCRDLLVSEKDAALLKAMEMLPARLRELREQVPGMKEDVPPEAIDLLADCITHPARIAITNKGFDEKTGMPGFGAVISFNMGADEAGAKAMHGRVEKIRAMTQMPFESAESKRYQGMTDLPLPMGVLSYGPRHAADGWRYEFIFAAVDDPDAAFKGLPECAKGVSPVLRGSLDLAACSPMVSMLVGFAAMASPEGHKLMDRLREGGVIGPDAIKIEWTLGQGKDMMQGTLAARRLGKHADALALTRATITTEDLTVIPADASYVDISKFDMRKSWGNMRRQLEAMGGEEFKAGYEQVKAALGFDPESELIEALGDTAIVYISDSTGGGSVLSAVLMMSLAEPAKVLSALDKGAAQANALLKQEVEQPAQIEVARFERGGVGYTQLRFPGLPIPVEPTVAIAGKWLVIGATPQAAGAAARHVLAAKPGGGIMANKAFTTWKWDLPGGAGVSVLHFVDASRTMRDGYSCLTFLSAAIENAMRTRGDANAVRDPGMVLPMYADLTKDANPMMMLSYWSGDDFITEMRGDRSLLVSMATVLGIGDFMPFVGGAIAGGAAGAGIAKEQMEHRGWNQRDEDRSEEKTDDSEEQGEEKTPY